MNIKHAVARFAFRLYNCTLGEDLTEKSSALSNAGKAVIGATTITAAAGGAAALSNNANGAGESVSDKINKTVGGSADHSEKVKSAFQ
jgi:hypothetical protein